MLFDGASSSIICEGFTCREYFGKENEWSDKISP